MRRDLFVFAGQSNMMGASVYRVSTWSGPIMKTQERFTEKHGDAYMLTRAGSYFPYAGRDESDRFVSAPDGEYRNCRDSFFGFENQHVNENGFSVIARHAASNLFRVLIERKEPIIEKEMIKNMLNTEETK